MTILVSMFFYSTNFFPLFKFMLSTIVVYMYMKSGSFSVQLFTDFFSCMLMFLTVIILMSSEFTTHKEEMMKSKKWKANIFIMSMIILWSFSCKSVFLFYVLFESIFLLMFLQVIGWGYSSERFTSAMYMMFYTLIVSIPLFIFLISSSLTSHYSFSSLGLIYVPSFVLSMSILLVFLVKFPMYTLHLWLPKAHVEAPIVGSMILAGILLKIGGYGVFRLVPLSLENLFKSFLVSLAIYSMVVVSLITLLQSDLKSLVAYSSVAHMAMTILGLLFYTSMGSLGSALFLVSHGLISSALFLMSYYFYNFSHSRSLLMSFNMFMTSSISSWLILFTMMSMSYPMTASFFSEVMILSSTLLIFSPSLSFLFFILLLFSIYSMILLLIPSSGSSKDAFSLQLSLQENFNSVTLWCPLLLLIFMTSVFLL